MEIDLIRDMNEIVAKRWLEENNIPVPANSENNFLEFLRWYRLQIPKISRKVFISKELELSENFRKYEKEIAHLKHKFENGEDVMPFTSKRKKSASWNSNPSNDYLLNDWNIHHFHLNTQLDKDNKVKRSKDLLFCFIDENNNNNVYFLNIYPHSNEDKSDNWSNKDLLEIMNNNWGDVLEPYRMEIIPDTNLNSKEIGLMRKSRVNSAVTIGDDAFLMIGGGYTVDGNSIQVTFWSISVGKQLTEIENMFKSGKIEVDYTINSVQLSDCLFGINKWNIKLTKLLFLVNGEKELLVLL